MIDQEKAKEILQQKLADFVKYMEAETNKGV